MWGHKKYFHPYLFPECQFSFKFYNHLYNYNLVKFNSLPKDNVLNWSKLKALADNKLNILVNLKFDFGKVESKLEKEENAGYQHFLLFQKFFKMAYFPGLLKVVIV